MQKAYGGRINWENYPSEETPINASNLNRMDYAINEIDDRVIILDTVKMNVEEADNFFEDVLIDNATGVITLVKHDGTTKTINTNLNKIAINVGYDRTTQSLVLYLPDGTTTSVSLSSFIQDNEFVDSETIAYTVNSGVVTSGIKAHSITGEHLQTDYLADIRVSEANALASATSADANAILSESWARGGTQTRTGEDTNNSMYFAQQSESSRQAAEVAKSDAQNLVNAAIARLTNMTVQVNLTDGCLYYDAPMGVILQVDQTTGNLLYDISAA